MKLKAKKHAPLSYLSEHANGNTLLVLSLILLPLRCIITIWKKNSQLLVYLEILLQDLSSTGPWEAQSRRTMELMCLV